MRRTLATLTIVALCGGVSVTAVSATAVSAAAAAGAGSESALRASVDTVGSRFFAAKEELRVLDEEMRALDHTLARTRSRVEALHPMAKATAVQLYQGSAQGFSGMFDVADAMESARRSELIASAGDHTQAVLDRYVNAVRILESQRTQLERARAKQARAAAALAKQRAALELLLAKAQQAYQNRLAALARANASQTNSTAPAASAPTASPPAPPAPVQVPAPAPPQPGINPHHDDPFLVCTRTRESSGDYGAVNGAGYYGAYQFSQPTWDVTANHAGSPQLIGVRPNRASPWDQDQLAWVLYQWQGRAPWLGLC